jgi:hypothetical protein
MGSSQATDPDGRPGGTPVASGSGGAYPGSTGPRGMSDRGEFPYGGSEFGGPGTGPGSGARSGSTVGVSGALYGPEVAPGFAPGLGGFTGGSDSLGAPPGIIGDFAPTVAISGLPQPPPIPPPNQPSAPSLPSTKLRSQLAPSVRGFKIADNQSPFPQDRVFMSFNYFNDVNAKLDRYFESPINQLNVYRYVFGFEKTFNDGKGSIGFRLPLDTIHANTSPGLINQGGQSTGLGNMTIFTKYVLEYNPETGNLLSVGLAITPPTGPGVFAGAKNFLGSVTNNTTIQPFVGYYVNLTDRLFFQGFSALDAPVNYSDVMLAYNDLALGYYLLRDRDSESITAVVPTVEAHINTPLNHRAAYSLRDPSGTADSVNVTTGLNVEVRRNSLFTFGVVTPTTGPRPFNVEAVALFNYRFGGPRRAQRTTPVIGG